MYKFKFLNIHTSFSKEAFVSFSKVGTVSLKNHFRHLGNLVPSSLHAQRLPRKEWSQTLKYALIYISFQSINVTNKHLLTIKND